MSKKVISYMLVGLLIVASIAGVMVLNKVKLTDSVNNGIVVDNDITKGVLEDVDIIIDNPTDSNSSKGDEDISNGEVSNRNETDKEVSSEEVSDKVKVDKEPKKEELNNENSIIENEFKAGVFSDEAKNVLSKIGSQENISDYVGTITNSLGTYQPTGNTYEEVSKFKLTNPDGIGNTQSIETFILKAFNNISNSGYVYLEGNAYRYYAATINGFSNPYNLTRVSVPTIGFVVDKNGNVLKTKNGEEILVKAYVVVHVEPDGSIALSTNTDYLGDLSKAVMRAKMKQNYINNSEERIDINKVSVYGGTMVEDGKISVELGIKGYGEVYAEINREGNDIVANVLKGDYMLK